MECLPVHGDRIRAARKAQGWTRRQLAAASTVSERVIDNLERGVSHGTALGNVRLLADALGVPAAELQAGPLYTVRRGGAVND